MLLLLDLHLPLPPEMAKQEALSDPDSLAPLVPANLETLPTIRRPPEANLMAMAMQQGLPAMLQENLPGKATQLPLKVVRPVRAKRPLPEKDLELRRTEQHLVRGRLLAAWAKLQDLRRRRVERFPVPPARVRRCLRCPGPCAFSRETPVARKCNRAARCDDRPIFARCRPPRNRRALAGCDNKCNRSQRKHVLPA